ncbi:hypothetical protein [Eilatimonas milleporae]|uniref:Uncharacterized protein n=1 Tax=Eilatimonas milleporae TaxID=911205 RepID=A0A3M0CUY6_9PROT|nr:hypothetical protein [Eilatimonas milleporae]RMB12370.1 hypothetical protein BXY39_0866 [Eilatimonas milleporae]
MQKVEVFLDSVRVEKNGNARSERGKTEDLMIALEWDDPNFQADVVQAAFAVEDVADGVSKDIRGDAGGDTLKHLNRRLFKTTLEGASVLKITVLKQEKLSGLADLFTSLLGAVFGTVTGGIGGIGGALAKTVVGKVFDVREDWEDPIGTATVVMDGDVVRDGGSLTVPLEINGDVKKALIKLYSGRRRDRRSVIVYEDGPSDAVMALVNATPATNGEIVLGFTVTS